MDSIRFSAKVSKERVIKLPNHIDIDEEIVDVVILRKELSSRANYTASQFVDDWAGIISSNNVSEAKLDYLSEKYK